MSNRFLLCPFYRWEYCGTGHSTNLSKVTQRGNRIDAQWTLNESWFNIRILLLLKAADHMSSQMHGL